MTMTCTDLNDYKSNKKIEVEKLNGGNVSIRYCRGDICPIDPCLFQGPAHAMLQNFKGMALNLS